MAKIEAKYLTKVYKDGTYALKNCSFSVKTGEFLVIVGESGSGKSTLLKVLSGTEPLSSGELYIDGILSDNIPMKKRDVSMVFQEYVLYPHMTVFDNLATPLKLAGKDEKIIYDSVMDTLRLFGLDNVADVKPKNLSGGEQQRVALAKTLLKRSKLVLFDEPMSNVDEKSRWEYCKSLMKMKKLLPDSTFIYVTHNTREALSLADRIAVMSDGVILQIAPTDFLTNHFEHLSVMELLGAVSNVDEGEYNGEDFLFDGITLEEKPELIDHSKLYAGQKVIRAQSNVNDECFHFFDERENSLSISSKELKFNGNMEGNVLTFEDITIQLDSEYSSRILRHPKAVDVVMQADKFSKIQVNGCVPLVFSVEKNGGNYVLLKTCDKYFILSEKTNLKQGEKIRLYYRIKDLILYDGDKRITCHYSLHRKIKIKIHDAERGMFELLGKRIKLGKPIPANAKYARITQKAFELSYKKGKCNLRIKDCLDEEFINGKKMIHVAVKGNDEYLSFMADESIGCFSKKKVWLNITPREISFI